MMKKSLTIFAVFMSLLLIGCSSSENEEEVLVESTETTQLLPIQDKYSEYTNEIISLFEELELNPEDYVPEDTSLSRVEFQAQSIALTGNYQNLTVENLNLTFTDVSIEAKDILKKLGRPDVLWIDSDFRSDGKTTYHIEVWWNKTEDTSTSESGYITMTWPMKNSNVVRSVVGEPSDVFNGRNQSIVELNEFKGAVQE